MVAVIPLKSIKEHRLFFYDKLSGVHSFMSAPICTVLARFETTLTFKVKYFVFVIQDTLACKMTKSNHILSSTLPFVNFLKCMLISYDNFCFGLSPPWLLVVTRPLIHVHTHVIYLQFSINIPSKLHRFFFVSCIQFTLSHKICSFITYDMASNRFSKHRKNSNLTHGFYFH